MRFGNIKTLPVNARESYTAFVDKYLDLGWTVNKGIFCENGKHWVTSMINLKTKKTHFVKDGVVSTEEFNGLDIHSISKTGKSWIGYCKDPSNNALMQYVINGKIRGVSKLASKCGKTLSISDNGKNYWCINIPNKTLDDVHSIVFNDSEISLNLKPIIGSKIKMKLVGEGMNNTIQFKGSDGVLLNLSITKRGGLILNLDKTDIYYFRKSNKDIEWISGCKDNKDGTITINGVRFLKNLL